jgi:hypothetical protein
MDVMDKFKLWCGPEMPKVWDLCPALTRELQRLHIEYGLVNSAHDFDHAVEVGQLAMVVTWPHNQYEARLAGIAGLLHNNDRILEVILNTGKETISRVHPEEVWKFTEELIDKFEPKIKGARDRIIPAVVHHGTKPNAPDDDLVIQGVCDGDRLANMGATIPIRSGQHNHNVRVLNPHTIQVDPSDRSPREKYNNPDSILYDLQNAADWYFKPEGPYALRLPKSREIGKVRAERIQRLIQDIVAERELVGLYPNYPF